VGLAAAAAAIGVTVLVMRRRRRLRSIIASAESRAPEMTSAELQELVERLELAYGGPEMSPLRRLLS
jgi:hypothetical protein